MGKFLAIGLMHKIIISCDDLKKKKISNEELRQGIQDALSFDLKQYDETEKDGYMLFTLKDKVLETNLIPFLEVFYPKVYGSSEKEYHDLLGQLRSMPYSKWLSLAYEKSNAAFQIDEYGEQCYVKLSRKQSHVSLQVNFNSLMMYQGRGKILTEGIDDFLNFFKYCIHETFKKYPIVKSVRVYVTG